LSIEPIPVSNTAKIFVPLLVVGAAAAWYFTQPGSPAPMAPAPEPPVAAAPPVEDAPPPVVQAAPPTTVAPEPDRRSNTLGNSHADAEQGVRGRIRKPDGTPAAGVPVFLMENVTSDIAQIFLNNRLGRTTPPVASTTSDGEGGFAMGIRKLGKPIDLRIVADDHPELSRQGIKVREGDWYDTGDLTLEAGIVVTGRVVDATLGTPIANATVLMAPANQTQILAAAPGRERGTPTTTDNTGFFRFGDAPRAGAVSLTAEAPGYAAAQLSNQAVRTDAANNFTLALDRGLPIAGVVVDATGAPVGGATVNANGLSAKTPQTATVVAAADGSFTFPTLRSGPYALVATSSNHAETRLPLVMAGDEAVKVVMSTRGTAKLRVLAADGKPVKAYRLGLLRYFPQNPDSVGKVLEWPDRSITPGDYPRKFDGQFALISGLPSGEYRFQIMENNHAKSLSGPFTVTDGAEPPEVVAQLTLGAGIVGTVVDDRGNPIADAVVASDMNNGLAAGSGLFEIFRTMMPEKHTAAQARTDAQGRFKLSRLAFASYMVRASHPDYCEGTAIDINLETEGQVFDVGRISLPLGAVVEGVVTIGGAPAGQVKVTVSTRLDASVVPPTDDRGRANAAAAPKLFHATVQTNNDGRFRLLKRVPPGTYKATAQRPAVGNDPFGALLDIRESERELMIVAGQDGVTVDFALNAR
jgi:protocatechuate 3,4-dioxygenase beta subunit